MWLRRIAFVGCLVLGIGAYGFLHVPVRPSVVIVTIDTMRADAVGVHMPALLAFLEESTRFPGARTVVPLTLPAHASLFTGLLPASHGRHDNVTEPFPSREERGFPLLAEEFRDAGYATAAFVAQSVLDPETGLDAGFDVYRHVNLPSGGRPYVPAGDQVDAALAWLAQRGEDRPYLLWVHLFDPHDPYLPFPGDPLRKRTAARDPAGVRYRGELSRVDAALERLLAGVGKETIVVVASDHGEGLGDHGEPTHGGLCYGSTVDAVLAVRAPGFPAAGIGSGPRSLCDVAPSLRALCSLRARPTDGAPLLGPPKEAVVTESFLPWGLHGWGQCFAASDGRFTLVESGPRLELFDRAGDPGELHPLEPLGHPAYPTLDRALQELRGTASREAGTELLASCAPYAGARRLVNAFYLPRAENAALPDPGPLLAVWERMEATKPRMLAAAARKDESALRAVIDELEELAEQARVSPLPYAYRAYALGQLGNLTGDREHYLAAARDIERSIGLGHLRPETFVEAARYCVLAKDPSELRRILVLAEEKRVAPGASCSKALADAVRSLGLDQEPEAYGRLARLIQH